MSNTVIHPPVQYTSPRPHAEPEVQEHQIPIFPIPEIRKKSRIRRMASKIKSADGFDEFGNAAGQTLPGIAAPIMTTTILALATPFVWLGVLGMKDEYKEAREEFERILQSKEAEIEKLKKLARYSETWTHIINEKCGLELNFSQTVGMGQNDCTPDECAENIYNHQRLKNEELIAALGKNYGWTGIVGMASMFVGMIPATGSAIAEITFEATAEAAAETAASLMSVVAGGFFLIGQVAMSVYAGNRARQGHKKINGLEELQDGLSNNIYIDQDLSKHVDSILGKEINYIKKHSTRYGKATIAGQAFMAIGTTLSMSGAGIAAAAPFFAIGAPVTLGAAVHRIVTENHEEHFKGNVSKYTEYKLGQCQPINLILKHQQEEGNQYQKAVEELGEAFNDTTNRLATMKCLSLLHHATNDRSWRSRHLTPWKQRDGEEKFDRLMKRFKGEKLKTSQLESKVVGDLESFLNTNKAQIIKILDKHPEDINQRLMAATAECLEGDHSPENLLGILDGSKGRVGEVKEKVDTNTLHGLGIKPPSDKEANPKKDSRQFLSTAKSALKSIRLSQAHFITDVVEIEKVAQQVGKDLDIDIYAKPEPQPEPNPDNHNVPRQEQEHIPTRLENFQERINQAEYNSVEEEEEQEATAMRQESREFTLKEGFPQTAKGKTVYIWQDPREGFKNDVSYHVFYIVDNQTGKVETRHGANACCNILINPNTQTQNGARVFSLKDGQCQSYGDSNNDLFGEPTPYVSRVNTQQQRNSQQLGIAS